MSDVRQSMTLPKGVPALGAQDRARSRSVWARARRHLARSTSGKVGLALVALVLLMALLAPVISPHDPYEQSVYRLYGPSLYFPFGTDEFGRDVMSRVIYGARVSLQVSLIAVAIALVVGGVLGLIAGYAEGWVDAVISRILDIVFAFPDILLALALLAVLGPALHNVMIRHRHRVYAVLRAHRARPGPLGQAQRVRGGEPGDRRSPAAHALPAHSAERDGAADRADDDRALVRDPFRGSAVLPGTRSAAADTLLGRHAQQRPALR